MEARQTHLETKIPGLQCRGFLRFHWPIMVLRVHMYNHPYLVFMLSEVFTATQISILLCGWVLVGSAFGLLASWVANLWFIRTGKLKYYDYIFKGLLLIGVLGYFTLAIC